MFCLFLADGFEEIEAVAPLDLLRRAGIDVKTVKIGGGSDAAGSHGVVIKADLTEEEVDIEGCEGIILPGGGAGVENLFASGFVKDAVLACAGKNKRVAAICAAPSILARLRLLEGKEAVSYPSFTHFITENGGVLSEKSTVTDGIFTTSAGAGTAIDFALELIRVIKDEPTAVKTAQAIIHK